MSLFRFLPTFKATSQDTNIKNKVLRRALCSLNYQQLEERRVLDASFTYDASASLLTIDDFDVGSDLSIDQNTASINGSASQDAYVFTLAAGTFDDGGGIAPSDFQISGNTLTVATDIFGGGGGLDANVIVDGSVGVNFVELTQANIANNIEFNTLEIFNIQNVGNSLELNVIGDVELINLSVVGNTPTTLPIADLSITTTGSINVLGTLVNAIENIDSGIELNATGGDSDVTISAAVTTVEGGIEIEAGDEVTFASTGSLTSADTGDLSVTANTDVAVDGDGSDGIVMAEGSFLDAGSGEITLSSTGADGGDIQIGSITTTNATVSAVTIDSNSAVTDSGSANSDIVADSTGAVVTISTSEGVGSGNALEIEVDSIDVGNTTIGNIELIEGVSGGDISILNLDNSAAAGGVSVQTINGTINVVAAGSGITAVAGFVSLDAVGAGSSALVNSTITTDSGDVEIESDEDAIVNQSITTSGGSVNISSNDDIRFGADGDITSDDGAVTVSANFDGNGLIAMADGALIDAGAGTITLEADEDITLGGLRTNNSTANAVLVNTSGSVLDGGDSDLEVFTPNGSTTINAGAAIGFVGGLENFFKIEIGDIDPIETFTAALNATAGNEVAVDEQNSVGIVTTSATTAFFTSVNNLAFADATPSVSNLALLAGGTLTLPATLDVSGDLRIEGADVVATDNAIDLTADRLLFVTDSTAAEVLATDVNELDVSSTGDLTVNNAGDLELIDLNCDHVAAQTIGSSSNLAINVAGDLIVIDDIIAGPVGDNNSSGSILLTSSGDVEVHDVVLADNGDITIQAQQDVTISTSDISSQTPPASPPITSTGIITTVVGDISIDAGGDIFMEDDSTVDARVIAGRLIVESDGAALIHDPAAPNIRFDRGAAGGVISLEADGSVMISTLQTTSNVDVTSNSEDIIVNTIEAQNVSLNAQDDVRDALFGDGKFILAQNLSIVAFDISEDDGRDGVFVETAVDNIDVEVGGDGRLRVLEADDITLDSITSSGRVLVNAGGNILATMITVDDAAVGNDIRLVSGGQIEISSLLADQSDVFLAAEDDVLSVGAAQPINADRLVVRASNSIDDGGNDGIIIATNVTDLNAVVSGTANPGVISVDETNGFVVETAINQNGSISIDAGGNLIARFLFARNATEANAIELSASGVGSDVATGHMIAAQRVGGIAITADDDIRPFVVDAGVSNLIAARELVLNAGNNFQDARFNGIFVIDGRFPLLDAVVTGAGESEIFVRNQGSLDVSNLSIQTGKIGVINSNANLNVQNATIELGNELSSISLKTEGGNADLRVGDLSARGSSGIFLIAADDIFDTSFMDDIFIDADRIAAVSNNSSEDGFDGIFLSARVDQINTQIPNGGQVFVAERS
ncbi:hypothetical protein OAG71_00940 [bacterium]|nr:hypothetical protein [bacterium]